MLWAQPTPAGERVWVWLRTGLDLSDLDGKTGKIAVTCWASEVRVARASDRFAALIRVDVSRRDPLGGVVASPFAALFGNQPAAEIPVSPGMPPLALDLPDVPDPGPVVPAGRSPREPRERREPRRQARPVDDLDSFI